MFNQPKEFGAEGTSSSPRIEFFSAEHNEKSLEELLKEINRNLSQSKEKLGNLKDALGEVMNERLSISQIEQGGKVPEIVKNLEVDIKITEKIIIDLEKMRWQLEEAANVLRNVDQDMRAVLEHYASCDKCKKSE